MPANLADPTHQKIDQLIKSSEVFLFMKGNRTFPQCGFSASVVQILDEVGRDYDTYNILEDPAVREGAKTFADWPTFPQLYFKGELVGGADIIRGMYGSGELHKLLGVELEDVPPPTVTITDWAAEVLREAAKREKHQALRIEVSPGFQYGLLFSEDRPGDFAIETNGFTVLVDRGSAKRADGLVLDYSRENRGFMIENPNEPPKVKQVSVKDLQKALSENPRLHLYDVRTMDERQRASIPGSKLFTPDVREAAMKLPKDTPLWFVCHTGNRSHVMGDKFIQAGFTKVFNVHGGIDAWSREIDPSTPRY